MTSYEKSTPGRAFGIVLAVVLMTCVLVPQSIAAVNGMIAFSSNRADYNDEIFIMNADGSRVTRLTYSLSSDREPAISPDGKTIVFVSDRHNQATSNTRTADLYLMNIDGTNIRRLTVDALPTNFSCDSCNLFGPVWNPGGTQIAFSNRKAIVVADVSSGLKTELSTPPTGFSDSNPTWNPDGTKIAFDRGNGQGNTTIYVMNADGANPNQLPYLYLATQPAWSPDGSQIAFVGFSFSYAMINIMNADGTGSVKTLNKATTAILGVPRWSLDGRYIAFESRTIDASSTPAGNSPAVELYLVDVNDTVRIRLTRNDAHDESPSFGPGSVPTNIQPPPTGFGRVAFMGGFTPVIGNPSVSGLFTMNTEGWDIRLVHSGGTDITVNGVRTLTTYSSPGFSADGMRLAMVKSTSSTGSASDSKLALMAGDGTSETIIPVYVNNGITPPTLTNVGSPALNPDGTKIVFASGRWGGLDFGIANADANLTGLFKWSHELLTYASWNPMPGDGRITYEWFNGVGKPTIAVASSCCSIIFNASADPPYSGDTLDRGIGYYSQCGAWPDGSVKKTFIGPPVWTSDGQSVAFVRQTLTQSLTSIANCGISEDKIELVVTNATTHVQTVIFQSDVINPTVVNPRYILQMAWSPQNNKLALLLNSNLYVMSSDGTNLKPITHNSGASGFRLASDSLSWLPTNFTQLPAVNYSIGGQVKDALGNPSSGVLITLSGGVSATRTTDASGRYVFSDLLAGSNYTVTPSGNLTPAIQPIYNLSGDLTVNFAGGTAYPFTVVKAGHGSGTVTSDVGIIGCGATCSDNYAVGISVTLTATPAAGSQFTGWLGAAAAGSQYATWQGACTGIGPCQLTISGQTAALATFAPTALGVPSLDIDGSTRSVALTDGLLVLRSLLGLSGASLVNGATGLGATRTSGAQVGDYLTDVKPILDVDGNGQADVLTDGLLVIRYLFGLRGGNLIAGAVGPGATRTTNTAIEAYIQALTRP